MTGLTSVQRAHDELLAARPSGAVHDDCPLCHSGAGDTEKAGGADVADEPKYTEAQHVAILTSAVERETASLATVKEELEARAEVLSTEKAAVETALSEAQTRIDVLEAEKAAAVQRADEAEKAHEEFVAELERAKAIEQAKEDRVVAIKAADASLEDDYFTEERVQRWAEMADEQFQVLVKDLTEAAAKRKPAFLDKEKDKEEKAAEQAAASRESAAFTGGSQPTAGQGSSLVGFFQATGKLPVTAS
jgi:hypothetical protein